MNLRPSPHEATIRLFKPGGFAVSMAMAFVLPSYAQMTPEEHAKHHPDQAKAKDKDGSPDKAVDGKTKGMGGTGGGMDMGKMMENMGKAPPRELYPTLMGFPELSVEQQQEVRVQAQERMQSGVALLSQGLDRLSKASENQDYQAMQMATGAMREGLARFESGLAANRALAEGKPPRQVALQWFKDEMSLQPPQGIESRGDLFGITPFHLFTMVLLVSFALAMVAMYFFKMRRAAALFGRIESDKGHPPPGSEPPAATAKVPSP